jgi:hypothetical protein
MGVETPLFVAGFITLIVDQPFMQLLIPDQLISDDGVTLCTGVDGDRACTVLLERSCLQSERNLWRVFASDGSTCRSTGKPLLSLEWQTSFVAKVSIEETTFHARIAHADVDVDVIQQAAEVLQGATAGPWKLLADGSVAYNDVIVPGTWEHDVCTHVEGGRCLRYGFLFDNLPSSSGTDDGFIPDEEGLPVLLKADGEWRLRRGTHGAALGPLEGETMKITGTDLF